MALQKAIFEKLNQKIFNYDWNILHNGSVDESCEIFADIFIEIVKQCIPYKKVCVRPEDQPWYDNAIRRLSRLAKSLAKASGKPALWLKYKNIRNRVNNMKKIRKRKLFFKNFRK